MWGSNLVKSGLISIVLALSLLTVPKAHGQKIIEDIGHYTQLGLPIGALGISIAKGDREGVIQLAKSVLVESVVVYGLKNLIDRPRPVSGGLSFPSGHTAISFTASTYLYRRYGWEYGVPATALAAFVGYSRFAPDEPRHYFSDVVAGAAIGILTSWIFTDRLVKDAEINLGYSSLNGSLAFSLKRTF